MANQVYIEGVPTTKTFDEGAGAESVGAVKGLGVENVLVGEEAAPLDPTAGRRGAGAALDEAQTPARCHPQGAEDIFGPRWHRKLELDKKGEMKWATEKLDRCLGRLRTPEVSMWRYTLHRICTKT